MSELSEAMEQFLSGMADEIKGNINSVSGKTASRVTTEVVEESGVGVQNVKGKLFGPIQLVVKETGRGPTKTRTAGNPTLQERLFEWIKARNIQPREEGMTQEQLSWAMAIKIHRDGDKTFSDSPTGYKATGVISDVITDDRINAFLETFGAKTMEIMLKSFKDRIKNGSTS